MADSLQHRDFIMGRSPRELCQSCQHASGPTFEISNLRDMYTVLHENTPITESERVAADANITYAQSEGILLDEEIIRVQRSLEALQKRRDALRRFEEQERALISPARKLPVELLCRIFRLATPCIYVYPSGDHEAFPLVAAQVCSRWRTISHSYSPLWMSFKFGSDHTTTQYHPKYGKLVDACLRFSKGNPLSFFLGRAITPKILGDTCVEALARSAPRHWESAIIRDGYLAHAIFAAIPEDSTMEYLESLELSGLKHSITIVKAPNLSHLVLQGDYREYFRFRLTIKDAPSLVHVDTMIIPPTAVVGLDWSQITTFKSSLVYQFNESTFTTALEQMLNLVHLILDDWIKTTKTITLACLETLTVHRSYPLDDDMNMFDTLLASRLKKLDVNWYNSSVIGIIRRSDMLDEMCVTTINDVCAAPEFSRIRILRWMSPSLNHIRNGLKKLTFNNTVTQDDVFTGVECLHIEEVDVPAHVVSCGWDIEELTDMLNSRLQAPDIQDSSRNYLKSINISFVGDVEDKDLDILDEFIGSELVRDSKVRVEILFGELYYMRTPE